MVTIAGRGLGMMKCDRAAFLLCGWVNMTEAIHHDSTFLSSAHFGLTQFNSIPFNSTHF